MLALVKKPHIELSIHGDQVQKVAKLICESSLDLYALNMHIIMYENNIEY